MIFHRCYIDVDHLPQIFASAGFWPLLSDGSLQLFHLHRSSDFDQEHVLDPPGTSVWAEVIGQHWHRKTMGKPIGKPENHGKTIGKPENGGLPSGKLTYHYGKPPCY